MQTTSIALTSVAALAALSTGALAEPPRLSLKIEPDVGFPTAGPQRDAFGFGGGGFLKAAYGPRDWLDLQLTGGGLTFDPKMGGGAGLFAIGGGPRLQFPQERNRVAPFVDGDALYVRTGDLDRFGFAATAGILFALDKPRTYWLGFHVRYLQVLQGEQAGYDTTDAHLVLLGVSTQFGVARKPDRDRDGDGVPDASDRCPQVAGPEANQGCPYLDADGDSVNDDVDRCPAVAGPADNQGCPYPDSDQDGVLDKADRCPSEAGPTQNDGCPWPDSDGDKVVDVDDKCPSVPGLLQLSGCPDSDGDGVPEPPDLCPNAPGPADNDGCPRYKQIVVTQTQIELSQKIFFAFGKATILPKSDGLLADVIQAFKDYPGLKVRIEGHTDAKGSLKVNTKLSQTRADAVRQYLIDHGVAADRITSAKGYGPAQPLDTNATAEGRERNRRVEFVVEGRGELSP